MLLSGKYETPLLKSIVMTYILHIGDMFDEILVMASRGKIDLYQLLHY